ncbi:hypothetical protein [Funiculus sociatus]
MLASSPKKLLRGLGILIFSILGQQESDRAEINLSPRAAVASL